MDLDFLKDIFPVDIAKQAQAQRGKKKKNQKTADLYFKVLRVRIICFVPMFPFSKELEVYFIV